MPEITEASRQDAKNVLAVAYQKMIDHYNPIHKISAELYLAVQDQIDKARTTEELEGSIRGIFKGLSIADKITSTSLGLKSTNFVGHVDRDFKLAVMTTMQSLYDTLGVHDTYKSWDEPRVAITR